MDWLLTGEEKEIVEIDRYSLPACEREASPPRGSALDRVGFLRDEPKKLFLFKLNRNPTTAASTLHQGSYWAFPHIADAHMRSG